MSRAVKVLVAHSQHLVGEALKESLSRHAELRMSDVVPTMGLDAVDAVLKVKPDVALLDHWLPVVGGPMATRMILARAPGTRIMILSWLQATAHIAEALQAGAVGYLPMSSTLSQVKDAILRASAGEDTVFGPELMEMLAGLQRREEESRHTRDLVSKLTPRDVRTLWLLSSGREMKEVAEALSITPGSLQMRLHHIFKKTGARSQIEAIAMAREHGLIPSSYPT